MYKDARYEIRDARKAWVFLTGPGTETTGHTADFHGWTRKLYSFV